MDVSRWQQSWLLIWTCQSFMLCWLTSSIWVMGEWEIFSSAKSWNIYWELNCANQSGAEIRFGGSSHLWRPWSHYSSPIPPGGAAEFEEDMNCFPTWCCRTAVLGLLWVLAVVICDWRNTIPCPGDFLKLVFRCLAKDKLGHLRCIGLFWLRD